MKVSEVLWHFLQQGPCIVEFPQLGEKVIFNVPEIKIVNARNENGRANLYSGAMNFIDTKNNYRVVIQFDFNKKNSMKLEDVFGNAISNLIINLYMK